MTRPHIEINDHCYGSRRNYDEWGY